MHTAEFRSIECSFCLERELWVIRICGKLRRRNEQAEQAPQRDSLIHGYVHHG